MLVVKIVAVGALTWSLPRGRDLIEGEELTVNDALKSLVAKHGQPIAEELLNEGQLKKGLSLLLNGRNVLSLPGRFETPLEDGDELIIATMLAGG
jgi:hypothetical protein